MYRMSLEIPQARVRVEKVFTICFLKGYFCVVNPPTAPRPPQKTEKPPSWEVQISCKIVFCI